MRAGLGRPCNQYGMAVRCEHCKRVAVFRRGTEPRDMPGSWWFMMPSGPGAEVSKSHCEVLCEEHIKDIRPRR